MKNNTLTIGILFITLLTFKAYGQEKGQTSWQEQLKSCHADIPLYYATKNQPKLLEAADKYKGIELALVTLDKKKGPTYKFYYLEKFTIDLGTSAYLVETKYLNQDRRPDHVTFLKYDPKKHFFYKADCFKESATSKDMKTSE
jgi:hypothetical protein